MYCEVGGDVCGEIGRLRHEKEVVCIVSGGNRYAQVTAYLRLENRNRYAQATAYLRLENINRYAQAPAYLRLENINKYAQDTGGVRGGSGRLGHENEDVCIESEEGMNVGDWGAWDTRIGWYVF